MGSLLLEYSVRGMVFVIRTKGSKGHLETQVWLSEQRADPEIDSGTNCIILTFVIGENIKGE